MISFVLLFGQSPPPPSYAATAFDHEESAEGYFALRLKPSGWRFRLAYAGRPKLATTFCDSGLVVMNCLYFNTRTGVPVGTVRLASTTVADDGHVFGTGFVWDDEGWQLVPAQSVRSYANGFQAGPTLVEQGQVTANCERESVNPEPYHRRLRVGVGRTSEGNTLLVCTRKGYTLQEFGCLMSGLGAREAVNLDGGSSAFISVESRDLIRSSRRVPAALVVEQIEEQDSGAPADAGRLEVPRLPSRTHARKVTPQAAQMFMPPVRIGLISVFQGIAIFTSILVLIDFVTRRRRGRRAYVLLCASAVIIISICYFWFYSDVPEVSRGRQPAGDGQPLGGKVNGASKGAVESPTSDLHLGERMEAAVSFFGIPGHGCNGGVVMLNPGESLDGVQARLGAEMIVSPGIFNPSGSGQIVFHGKSRHMDYTKPAGFFWWITPDGKLERGDAPPGRCSVGAWGPAYVVNGRVRDLARQSFTRGGGQFGMQRRMAVAADMQGQVLIAVSNRDMYPAEFAESLVSEGQVELAVGLSGGPHLALYANGAWYAKTEESMPYVFVFGSP